MAKVLTPGQWKTVDAATLQQLGISQVQLVQRAAAAFVHELKQALGTRPLPAEVMIFAGAGLNGADGFAIGMLLHHAGVKVHCFFLPAEGGAEPQESTQALMQQASECFTIQFLDAEDNLPEIKVPLVIDALFGLGLNRPLAGMPAKVVHHINDLGQEAEVVSVDIPSGMACTESSVTWPRVHAHLTITFQALKLAHVMPENGPALGAIRVGNIGLSEAAIEAQSTSFYVTDEAEMAALLKPRSRFAHKGHFGRALLAGGSMGKVGAIVLAAKACLRAGAGLVTAYVPKSGLEVLQTAVPEAMVVVDPDKKVLTSAPAIENYAAIGIGPGMGTTSESAAALQMLLEKAVSPVVLDADAINILGLYPAMQALVPPHSVLTPHAREFKRLAGTSPNDFEALAKLMAVAKKLKSVILFKGAYTCIASPEGQVYFNNTGNAGMATAGSGDALTGIIVSLMAQGYDSVQAARLGAWVHGHAGDMAAEALGEHGLIASDIIQYLPRALKQLAASNLVLAGSR